MDTEKIIYEKLTAAGCTPAGACGLMGNLYAESALDPGAVEILCLKRLKEAGKLYTNATYAAFVDDGTISKESFLNPLPGKMYGYGLAQWTWPERKAGLYDLARSRKTSISDLGTQMDYLIAELKDSYSKVWKILTTTGSVRTAAETVLKEYERPAKVTADVVTKRTAYGQKYFDELAKKEDKTMTKPEKALAIAQQIANDQIHGYSQQTRWGPDFDCSSLVIYSYEQAGVPLKSKGATYTGNLREVALSCGFEDVTKKINLTTGAGLQKGDILLYHISGPKGHTAMYAGNGQITHARGQSFGSSKTGDQGSEIATTAYTRSQWQYVLRYTGREPAAASPAAPTKPVIKRYQVSCTMPIIKKGSFGMCVRLWQQYLGVQVDGEFGAHTHEATIKMQRALQVTADGEVGPKTWGAALSIAD